MAAKRGRKLSAAHKAAIAAANTGKRRTPETKIRMSLARREMLRRKFGVGWAERLPVNKMDNGDEDAVINPGFAEFMRPR